VLQPHDGQGKTPPFAALPLMYPEAALSFAVLRRAEALDGGAHEWEDRRLTYLGIFLAVLAAITVAGYLRVWTWTGLVAAPDDERPKAKTLWDWLQLLIVPAVLAAGAYGINTAQTHRDQQREDKRARQQDKIAANGRRDDALRAYLQQMSGLIANNDLSKARQRGKDSLAGLAQSLTLNVLRQLDGPRKSEVVQFLVDSKLIINNKTTQSVIDMYRANLRGAKLKDAFLVGADFTGADFVGADLRGAVLNNADFSLSNLRRADFSESYYGEDAAQKADFSETCLTGTRFTKATLYDSKFLKAEGRDVDFSAADVEGADFEGAKLTNVNGRHTTYGDATFPKGWGPRGLRIPKRRAAKLCKDAVVAPP
jgi:uncharacterized protein YjbI with pentapeptide repeats